MWTSDLVTRPRSESHIKEGNICHGLWKSQVSRSVWPNHPLTPQQITLESHGLNKTEMAQTKKATSKLHVTCLKLRILTHTLHRQNTNVHIQVHKHFTALPSSITPTHIHTSSWISGLALQLSRVVITSSWPSWEAAIRAVKPSCEERMGGSEWVLPLIWALNYCWWALLRQLEGTSSIALYHTLSSLMAHTQAGTTMYIPAWERYWWHYVSIISNIAINHTPSSQLPSREQGRHRGQQTAKEHTGECSQRWEVHTVNLRCLGTS